MSDLSLLEINVTTHSELQGNVCLYDPTILCDTAHLLDRTYCIGQASIGDCEAQKRYEKSLQLLEIKPRFAA